jgi:hypothetical protein
VDHRMADGMHVAIMFFPLIMLAVVMVESV